MRATATLCLTCLIALPAASCAQTEEAAPGEKTARNRVAAQRQRPTAEEDAPPDDRATRRLESVTWDSVRHQLAWVVSKGEKDGPEYKPLAKQEYLINMDKATMTVHGETRGFSREEAVNVRVLMDLIAKYAVDSTVWWDGGEGERVDENGNPKARPKPKQERQPSQDEGVALMRVSNPSQPASQSQVQSQIRELEERLAALRRLDRSMTAEALQVRTF
jgi:hypothetical protein